MGGRLEHEIRLLPQVLACSFSEDDDVVVLIDPSADPQGVRPAVERILRAAGSDATVRLIGPPEPVEAAATRVVSPLVATATVATVAAIGVGALVGGLAAAAEHRAPPVPAIERPAASAAPTDSLDVLRGVQVSASSQVTLPVEAPDHHLSVLPTSRGSAAEAISLTRAIPPVHGVSAKSASGPSVEARRGAPHEHLTGKGPRPWSHSSRFSGNRGKGKGRG